MRRQTNRLNGLLALRRRDRAKALDDLAQARENKEKISSLLFKNRNKIKELENGIEIFEEGAVVLAGQLETRAASSELKQAQLKRLAARMRDLEADARVAAERVEEASARVAKAQQALVSLEDKMNRSD